MGATTRFVRLGAWLTSIQSLVLKKIIIDEHFPMDLKIQFLLFEIRPAPALIWCERSLLLLIESFKRAGQALCWVLKPGIFSFNSCNTPLRKVLELSLFCR